MNFLDNIPPQRQALLFLGLGVICILASGISAIFTIAGLALLGYGFFKIGLIDKIIAFFSKK